MESIKKSSSNTKRASETIEDNMTNKYHIFIAFDSSRYKNDNEIKDKSLNTSSIMCKPRSIKNNDKLENTMYKIVNKLNLMAM